MTAEEFWRLPRGQLRTELIRGTVIPSSSETITVVSRTGLNAEALVTGFPTMTHNLPVL
jgi:hypothetical protein